MMNPGFFDGVVTSVDNLNDLLHTHMPLAIHWTMGQISYTFQLNDMTVKINNKTGFSVTVDSLTIPRKRLDALRAALQEILQAALEDSSWSAMSFGVMLLQMDEESFSHLEDWTQSQQKLLAKSKTHGTQEKNGWDASSGDIQSMISNPFGVNLLTVNDTAKFLLRKSIKDILARLPSYLRILHVEPVFRDDLIKKFTRKRYEMREHFKTLSYEDLRKCVRPRQLKRGRHGNASKEDLADILATPKVTFHGAPRHVMQSIVRYGFAIPGQKIGGVTIDIRCGASFGIGIYSSPSIEFASAYASVDSGWGYSWQNPADVPGLRMVVCATLMGRPIQVTRNETRRTEGLADGSANSHVSPNGKEYIVFENAQIIPCYVLNLDYGSDLARMHFDAMGKSKTKSGATKLKSRLNMEMREDEDSPAAKKAKKEELQAAAAKWFPFGFGPATGTNFVIEEIGDVSDDEEVYGDYQGIRQEQDENAHVQPDRFADETKSWFDEFQTVRITKEQVYIDK